MGRRVKDACCCCDECCEPADLPAEITLSITNSNCGVEDGDYTLTLSGATYEGSIGCDGGTLDITLACGQVTSQEGCRAAGWELSGDCFPFQINDGSLNYTCNPFSVVGQGALAGGCCGCGVGGAFDWEVSE